MHTARPLICPLLQFCFFQLKNQCNSFQLSYVCSSQPDVQNLYYCISNPPPTQEEMFASCANCVIHACLLYRDVIYVRSCGGKTPCSDRVHFLLVIGPEDGGPECSHLSGGRRPGQGRAGQGSTQTTSCVTFSATPLYFHFLTARSRKPF